MKIIVFGLFSLLAVVDSAISFDSISPDPADGVDLPVEIDVDCPGVDFSKLSLPAAGYSSKALQDTYNKVHQDVDGGDSFLKKTHFDHAVRKTKKHRPKTTVATTVAAAAGSSGLRGSAATGEAELGWSWKTNRYYGSWMGDWGCRLCPYLLSSSGSDGIAVRAWETAFVEAILVSGHKEFANAKTCTITIGLAHVVLTNEEESELLGIDEDPAMQNKVEQEDDPVQMSVEIDAGCEGVDYHKLSIEAIGFASKALQETYNNVHQDLDGGDSFLSKTHFDHAFKKKRTKVDADFEEDGELGWSWKQYWGSWMGDWGCRLCPDDLIAFDSLGVNGIAVHAWEAEFTAKLAGSKHKEFAKAKDCNIDIFSKPVVANTAPLASA